MMMMHHPAEVCVGSTTAWHALSDLTVHVLHMCPADASGHDNATTRAPQ